MKYVLSIWSPLCPLDSSLNALLVSTLTSFESLVVSPDHAGELKTFASSGKVR
jgi:hypothetical protein